MDDNMNTKRNIAIYDIQGRLQKTITEKGIYIINGKKYVK